MYNIYPINNRTTSFSAVWWIGDPSLSSSNREPPRACLQCPRRWRRGEGHNSGICFFSLIFIFFVLMALLMTVSSLRFMFQCGQKTLNSAGIETGYFFDCYILTILDFSTFTSKKLDPKCILCMICWNQNSSDNVRSYWLAKKDWDERREKRGREKKGKRPKTDTENASQDIANPKTIAISNTSSILRTALEQSFLLIPSFGWTNVA